MPTINGGYISFGGTGTSSSSSSSGIQTINSQSGPDITITGGSGIYVQTNNNIITINASGIGTVNKYVATFTAISSGLFSHNLNTRNIILNVFDTSFLVPERIEPDKIKIEDLDHVSLVFNKNTTGYIVIMG